MKTQHTEDDYCIECNDLIEEDEKEYCICGEGPFCLACLGGHEVYCDDSDDDDDDDAWDDEGDDDDDDAWGDEDDDD